MTQGATAVERKVPPPIPHSHLKRHPRPEQSDAPDDMRWGRVKQLVGPEQAELLRLIGAHTALRTVSYQIDETMAVQKRHGFDINRIDSELKNHIDSTEKTFVVGTNLYRDLRNEVNDYKMKASKVIDAQGMDLFSVKTLAQMNEIRLDKAMPTLSDHGQQIASIQRQLVGITSGKIPTNVHETLAQTKNQIILCCAGLAIIGATLIQLI